MAGKAGGYRPGSGAKKGQHRVHVKELRDAIEARVGKPYQEILADTFAKLYTDFLNDINVREYLTFNEHMNKRIVEHQIQEVAITNPMEELSKEEIEARVAKLMALESSSVVNADPDDNDAQDNNGDNDASNVVLNIESSATITSQ